MDEIDLIADINAAREAILNRGPRIPYAWFRRLPVDEWPAPQHEGPCCPGCVFEREEDRTLYKSYRLPDEVREGLDELYEAQRRLDDRVFGSPEFQEIWSLSQITGRRINIEVVQSEGEAAKVVMTLEESAHE